MYPQTDQPLRDMPLATKEDGLAYVAAYRDWLYANSALGNGAFLGANSKPATIRAPDLVAKARIAHELAELNYWQMPYERARVVHYGLPYAKWRDERAKRGLPAGEQPTESSCA